MKKKKSKETFDYKRIHKELRNSLYMSSKINRDESLDNSKYSTGVSPLDKLLNGGFPQGGIIGFMAEWNIGKTIMLIRVCANIISHYNKHVYYIDVDGGASYEMFENVDYSLQLYHPEKNPSGKLHLLKLDSIQDIEETVKKVTSEDDTAVIIIDFDTRDVDDLRTSCKNNDSKVCILSKDIDPIRSIIKESNTCLVLVHQAKVKLTDGESKIELTDSNATKHLSSADIKIFFSKKNSEQWLHNDIVQICSFMAPLRDSVDSIAPYIS